MQTNTDLLDIIKFINDQGTNLGSFTEMSKWQIEDIFTKQGRQPLEIRTLVDIAVGVGLLKECGVFVYLRN